MVAIPSPDQELLQSYLAGDVEAVATVQAWIERAAGAYRARLGHQWDDLLQDLRLEVYRTLRRGSFRGRSTLKTYVWRVVNHSCLDHVRSLKRWRWVELGETRETFEQSRRTAERLSERRVQRDLLLRVVNELGDECRKLWSMIVAGMSYREIGRVVGASEGTLRVRALRCRQKAIAHRDRLLAEGGSADAV